MIVRCLLSAAFAAAWFGGFAAHAVAQPNVLGQESYIRPPKEIADAVEALSKPNLLLTNLSPDGRTFLIPKSDVLPPISRVGRHHVHLGGIALDPVASRAHDLWVRSVEGYDLFDYKTKKTVSIKAPAGTRLSSPLWSPDGSKLAFLALSDDANHLMIADVATGSAKKLSTSPVLATLATQFQWSKDGKRILTVLLPNDGKKPETKTAVVAEPKVRVARPGPNPSRTYRFLLESPEDMKLLEQLTTGQLAMIDVADGRVAKVGTPAMIRTVSASPGEKQFRVTEVKKPFSYYVPATNFGSLESVWDLEGKKLLTVNDRNLRETEPTPPTTTPPAVAGANPAGGAPAGGAAGPGRGGRGGRGGAAGGPGAPPAGNPPPANPNPQPPADPQPPVQPDPMDPDAPRGPAAPVDPDGKRDLGWRPDGAGLSYLQLEPAKAKDDKAPRKDRVMLWVPPFGKDDAKEIYSSPNRILSIAYSENCDWMFLTQVVDSQRQITAFEMKDLKNSFVIHRSGTPRPAPTTPEKKSEPAPTPKPAADPAKGGKPPAFDDESDDDEQPPAGGRGPGGVGGFGATGGTMLMTKPGRGGASVARISSKDEVYVTGSERAAGGAGSFAKPYIEKIAIRTGKKERIFEAKGDMTETIDAVNGDDITAVFTTRQKSDVVPDSYVTEIPGGKQTKLTENVNRAPWNSQLSVQRFRVTRVDGIKFWVKVTLPNKDAKKLPALFWIYPREYTDQAQYDQRSGGLGGGGAGGAGAGRFVTPGPRAMQMICLAGYALVEPDVPIIGPAGRMNDNYIHDLRNTLWAAIDDLDKRGLIDRDKLACGGHSYGAFSTANAMAHTPFFKAGIAGDGNYNRTLTTMTFQSERRHLWEARETYLEMSPLLWANRVNGALLMYHGMDDANVGTAPINAELMYLALDGLGKPCSLYMYPYEGHGPIAKETTLDLWARWCAWLDMYCKNPKK